MSTLDMTNNTIEFPFCQNNLDEFHTFFNAINFKLSLCICIFGCITNVLNFIVLSQKDLRTHINYILTGLAISDFLVMLVYFPYALDHAFSINSRPERLTYGYAHYIYTHAMLSQTAHTVSIFLTITLALWRYISVCHPSCKNAFMNRTLWAIIASYVISPIICLPYYMSLTIQSKSTYVYKGNMTEYKTSNINDTESQFLATIDEENGDFEKYTKYYVQVSSFYMSYNQAFLWVYSVIIKLLPCMLLTYFSVQLVRTLYEAKKRKEKLSGNLQMSAKLLNKKKQADRTTKMLIAVLFLFLITEVPQGILGLMSAVLHQDFYLHCYQKLGDLMDFLALLNSSINFILYCSMSRQFRDAFTKIFLPRCLVRTQRRIANGNGFAEVDSHGRHVETMHETQMTQL
ncbi:G-protein coupled receptor dmsr-1-like [Chironomus tepperi]|uniref:G-protein coupled receptor dmsr-1-like n=1 Tax=Chironomus tepperi TaxID=113505 RepID=UPI00391F1D40